jgi:hypothetical protein
MLALLAVCVRHVADDLGESPHIKGGGVPNFSTPAEAAISGVHIAEMSRMFAETKGIFGTVTDKTVIVCPSGMGG